MGRTSCIIYLCQDRNPQRVVLSAAFSVAAWRLSRKNGLIVPHSGAYADPGNDRIIFTLEVQWGMPPVLGPEPTYGPSLMQASFVKWQKLVMPTIRRVYPTLMAAQLVGVQPMSTPTSLRFYINARWQSAQSIAQYDCRINVAYNGRGKFWMTNYHGNQLYVGSKFRVTQAALAVAQRAVRDFVNRSC